MNGSGLQARIPAAIFFIGHGDTEFTEVNRPRFAAPRGCFARASDAKDAKFSGISCGSWDLGGSIVLSDMILESLG